MATKLSIGRKLLERHALLFRSIVLLAGLTTLVVAAHMPDGWWFTRLLTTLGAGTFVSGLVSIIFPTSVAPALEVFRQQATEQLSADITKLISNDAADLKSYVREIQKNLFSARIQRTVFNSGIIGFQKSWAGLVDEDFLRSQATLDIFLKDGRTFFEERRAIIRERLFDPRKTTRILILHPDYEYIRVVAETDEYKRKNPAVQREECLLAIRSLQEIAAEADVGAEDVQTRNMLRGYRVIPTWNGFIGDDRGFMHLYFSRPYRGDLNTIEFIRTGKDDLYEDLKEDMKEIIRDYAAGESSNLWRYKI